MRPTDRVSVTTVVAADAATAFALFTTEIDAWWRRDSRHQLGPSEGRLRFEGGRLLQGDFEVGKVLAWEPGARLAFEWRNQAFAPGERTEVEIRFEPEKAGTRLTLVHRGWDSLPRGHKARHGLTGTEFESIVGCWWADLFVSLAAYAARR